MIHIALESVGGVPVARPRGDVDAANATAVDIELADAIGRQSASLVVDLSDTAYVDSAGLDVLLRLSERLRQRRARLLLVIPTDSQLGRLAEIVGLPEAMPVHETLSQALADHRSYERLQTGESFARDIGEGSSEVR